MTSTYPTYVFNGHISSSQGYYISNINNGAQMVLQSDNKFSIDINPNGSTGANGKLGKITFFHDSIIADTTPYILIDNTNTSSTQTASIRFVNNNASTTYGTIFGSSTTGLNFNNNGSIGYITMTLGSSSTSSTLNFVKSDNSLYGSIVGNTSGLNIAGSGASSTVQINNFKTLNITGVDATSSVQISNITSLNAPGLDVLSTSQVGTSLCLNPNNDIVKNDPVHFYINAETLSDNICTFYYNSNNQWIFGNKTIFYVQTNLILINPTPAALPTTLTNSTYGRYEDKRNWPTTTNWVYTNSTVTHSSGTGTSANLGPLLGTIKAGLIKFPVSGLYYISINLIGNLDNVILYFIKNFNRNTPYIFNEEESRLNNILNKIELGAPRSMASCITYIDNNWDSTTPDTISIALTIGTGGINRTLSENFTLTITKLY